MSSHDTEEIRGCYLVEEREMSVLIEKKGIQYWIPRSQIAYMRRYPKDSKGIEIVIVIPLWFAEKKGLE